MLLLLADTLKSPLLHSLHTEKSAGSSQLVVRAIILLLQAQKGLEIQKFVVDAVTRTPQLVVGLFHSLAFPDSKRVFDYVSSINFVSRIIRDGPSIAVCSDADSHGTIDRFDRIILSVLPNGLRKPQITKALAHSNALVVAEMLKFLFHALNKVRSFLENQDASNSEAVRKRLAQQLPDLQAFLAMFQRFKVSNGSPNSVIVSYACSVIQVFTSIYPQKARSLTFEWAKVLPTGTIGNASTPVSLAQMKILASLSEIHSEQVR
jgi:hypothetical protein